WRSSSSGIRGQSSTSWSTSTSRLSHKASALLADPSPRFEKIKHRSIYLLNDVQNVLQGDCERRSLTPPRTKAKTMLNVLKTLLSGASARAEEAVPDVFAIDLIEQKIREAEASLNAAKGTLASLIIRRRNEERHFARLDAQIKDLEGRATLALDAGN